MEEQTIQQYKVQKKEDKRIGNDPQHTTQKIKD